MKEWIEVKEVVLAEKCSRETIVLWQQIVMYHKDQFPNIDKSCYVYTTGCQHGF